MNIKRIFRIIVPFLIGFFGFQFIFHTFILPNSIESPTQDSKSSV